MSMADKDYVMKASKAVNNDIPKIYESKTDAEAKLTEAKKYADNKVAGLVNSAPKALDTLSELSKALGDDENFATNVLGQIGDIKAKLDAINSKNLAVELDADANLDYLKDGLYHLPRGHNSFPESLGHNYPYTLYQTSSSDDDSFVVQIIMCPKSIMWRGFEDRYRPGFVPPSWIKLSLDVIDNLTSTDKTSALSANQGRTLSYRITNMQGDVNTNTTRINNKVDKSSIYDDLDSDDSSKVLSANQGKVLNDKIGDIDTALDNIIAIQNELMGVSE